MSAELTYRQERFVFEFLKDQNASAAAARAGYTAQNLAQQGSELMNHPAVRERVRIEMQSLLAEIRCSAVELMKQRMRAAFFDPGKLFGAGWEPLGPDELDAETRAALEVNTVLRKSGPVVRMKQMDRHRALRALEKVHERLDRLNEQHWAKLEREGRVKSLEEIERMDLENALETAPQTALEIAPETAPAPDAAFSKIPQVLSGGKNTARAPGPQISENPQVLSGSAPLKATPLARAVASVFAKRAAPPVFA